MTNNAGTIANAGTFNVTGEFIENDGTTTGNPINIIDAYLYFTGTGASSFTIVAPDESDVTRRHRFWSDADAGSGELDLRVRRPMVNQRDDRCRVDYGGDIDRRVGPERRHVHRRVGQPDNDRDGSFTQGSSGTTQVDLGDPVNYGRLTVAGTASLAGQLVTSTSFTPTAGTGFSIINSTGALSGTFSSYAFGSEPYTLAYTPNSVEITGAMGLAVTTTSLPQGRWPARTRRR